MYSGVRRLADLRREASDAARELQGGEDALDTRELRILLGVSGPKRVRLTARIVLKDGREVVRTKRVRRVGRTAH